MTTFGGDRLACAAGNAVLEVVLAPGFLEKVQRKANKLRGAVEKLARGWPQVLLTTRRQSQRQHQKPRHHVCGDRRRPGLVGRDRQGPRQRS